MAIFRVFCDRRFYGFYWSTKQVCTHWGYSHDSSKTCREYLFGCATHGIESTLCLLGLVTFSTSLYQAPTIDFASGAQHREVIVPLIQTCDEKVAETNSWSRANLQLTLWWTKNEMVGFYAWVQMVTIMNPVRKCNDGWFYGGNIRVLIPYQSQTRSSERGWRDGRNYLICYLLNPFLCRSNKCQGLWLRFNY